MRNKPTDNPFLSVSNRKVFGPWQGEIGGYAKGIISQIIVAEFSFYILSIANFPDWAARRDQAIELPNYLFQSKTSVKSVLSTLDPLKK